MYNMSQQRFKQMGLNSRVFCMNFDLATHKKGLKKRKKKEKEQENLQFCSVYDTKGM